MGSHYTPIPIIDRMSHLLKVIIASPDGVKAKSLLHTASIPKTTFYRLLTSMVDNNLLSYHPESDCYTLGRMFTSTYAHRDEQIWSLRDLAGPYLKELACDIEETVKLAIISGICSYTICVAESDQPMRISIDLGSVFPLHVGAAGKVFMCGFEEAFLQYYSEACDTLGTQYTNKTILTMEALRQELLLTRKRGYAIDLGEFSSDICAISVPVLNSIGQTIAAISVVYPAFKQQEIDIPTLVQKAKITSGIISDQLNTKSSFSSPRAYIIYE